MNIKNKERLFEMMEKINPEFNLQQELKLLLPVGISGSGKSTWIKSQIDPNTVVVSFDDIRREVNNDVTDHTGHFNIINVGLQRIANALNSGKNVILDATNIKSKDRKSLMAYLKERVKKPFNAYAKIFDVDPEIAKQRVRNDINTGVDRSNVPNEVIDRQYQTFTNDFNKIESDGYKIIK